MIASTRAYTITIEAGSSTEKIVAAGAYAYVHSCLTSEHFPMRGAADSDLRHIVLLGFDRVVDATEALALAEAAGLRRPRYEDALVFGAQHPEAQREHPIVFLHDPWFGLFGRRDVLYLWTNAGQREIGLEGIDATWDARHRFAFARVA